MADDVYRITMQIEGEEKVERLRAAVELAEQRYRSFQEAQRAGQASSAAVDAQRESFARLRAELGQAESALSRLNRSGNRGAAILEASRGLEDLQYGIGGVLNNLPGLVAQLGGGAGLAGVVSMVAVGATVLYRNWDSVAKLWGGGHAKTQAEELAELAKATSLTADQAERLARANALKETVKETRAGKTKEQEATDKAVKEAIIEAGSENVAAGMIRTRPDLVETQGTVPAAIEARKKAEADLADYMTDKGRTTTIDGEDVVRPISQESINSFKAAITEANIKVNEAKKATAEEIANTGAISKYYPGGPGQFLESVAKDPAAFGPGGDKLLTDLKDASPEGRKAKLEAEGESDTVWEESQQSIAEMKKYQKKGRDDEAKALEAQARDGEKAWDESVKEAARTKSYMGKAVASLTPAEKEAKRVDDQREEGKAKEKQEKDAEDRKKNFRKDVAAAPGLDDFIRDQMLMGASNQQLGGMLKGLGLDDAMTTDMLNDAGKSGYEKLLKDSEGAKSTTISGGQALRDAIQGGVGPDLAQKQLDRLVAMEGYLSRIADQRPDLTARAT